MKRGTSVALGNRPETGKHCKGETPLIGPVANKSQNALNLVPFGSLEDKMMQSRFYVFLAVGKLLFGRGKTSQAIDFASGMVGETRESSEDLKMPDDSGFKF